MVRYFEQEAERMLPASAVARKMSDPAVRMFLEQHPYWQRQLPEWGQGVGAEDDQSRLRELARARMQKRGHPSCEYCEGMKHQMRLAHTMLAEQPPKVRERFLYETIKETVTHEVGHTLGLRHNFKASSIYSLDEIKRRRTTGQATCGSVMDYNPVLFFGEQATEGHFVTPTIGPYDYWAIEYGYRPYDHTYKSTAKKQDGEEEEGEKKEEIVSTEKPPEAVKTKVAVAGIPDISEIPPEILEQLPPEVKKMLASGQLESMLSTETTPSTPSKAPTDPSFTAPPSGEEGMLLEIAGRATEPELAYATDEDTTFASPDPRSNRFDMGADPLDWARTRIELVNQRMANILEWAVKDAESWYHLRSTFLTLLVEKTFVMDYVGRYIGGQYFNRAHRGDLDAPPPFVLVEPERQRAALTFIEDNLFTDEFFGFSPEVLNHLAPSRWWHQDSWVSYSMDFPVHDIVALLQWWNLFDRLYPGTLRRIHDAELKTTAADKLTAAEYLQRIQTACWSDATDTRQLQSRHWSDNEPFLSSIRRSLQREYLGLVEPLVRQRPGRVLSPDLHAMLQYSLQKLAYRLSVVLNVGTSGKLDFASEAHLATCKSRIERMLSAELREYEPFSFGSSMFMRPNGNPMPGDR